mgnify:CR=1 FL=1
MAGGVKKLQSLVSMLIGGTREVFMTHKLALLAFPISTSTLEPLQASDLNLTVTTSTLNKIVLSFPAPCGHDLAQVRHSKEVILEI